MQDYRRAASGVLARTPDGEVAANPRGLLIEPIDLEEDPDTGIEFEHLGDGVWRITIPDGTGPHADQTEGRTAKWLMRSFVNGEPVDLSDLRGNIEVSLQSVTDPSTLAGTDVQVSLGYAEAGDGGAGSYGGIEFSATPRQHNHRNNGASVVDYTPGAPAGDIAEVRWSAELTSNPPGIRTGNMGAVSIDASGDAIGTGEDTIVGGFLDVGSYIALNVFCPTLISGDVTIDVRPRVWAHEAP